MSLKEKSKECLSILGFEVDKNLTFPDFDVEVIQLITRTLNKIVSKSITFDQKLESDKFNNYRNSLLDIQSEIDSLNSNNPHDKSRLNEAWGLISMNASIN